MNKNIVAVGSGWVSLLDMAEKERARVRDEAILKTSLQVQVSLGAVSCGYMFYDPEFATFVCAMSWTDWRSDVLVTGTGTVRVDSELYTTIYESSYIPDYLYRQMTLGDVIELDKANKNYWE